MVFSIRRSGTSHITSTRTYNAHASHDLTNASGIATKQITIDILPLKSAPSAVASTESGEWIERSERARMKYAMAAHNSTTPYRATGPAANLFSPIHRVTKGISDSQNSR